MKILGMPLAYFLLPSDTASLHFYHAIGGWFGIFEGLVITGILIKIYRDNWFDRSLSGYLMAIGIGLFITLNTFMIGANFGETVWNFIYSPLHEHF